MLSALVALLRRAPRAGALLALVGFALLSSRAARAAQEKRIGSSTTTLELEADGHAVVHHELMLEVRGAPFTELTLRGVDADAEPLPDATLTRLVDGQPSGAPEPVLVRAQGGQLEVSVRSPRGLRGASFLLKVGYRTRLADGELVRHLPDGTRSELGWTGPRFDDGVDAVTLILRTRAAQLPPELAPESGSGPGYGMVMSTLRRSRDIDELELVRAHVARDEAIRWSVLLDRSLLPPGVESTARAHEPSAPAPAAALAPPPAPRPQPLQSSRVRLGLALAGAAFALLVALKARAVAAAAALRGCEPRPWLGWSAPLRALAAGASLAAAGALALSEQPPFYGALALLFAMACAAYHRPREGLELRGPGVWQPLEPSALTSRAPATPLPGAWLDAGRVRGFVLMVAALAGVAFLAARLFDTSPYLGACLLLGSSVLLPLFCTGRAGELPPDGLSYACELLGDVARRLARDATLVVKPIGRVAAASGELDELRLSIATERPVPGLLGIELGLELREHLGGYATRPVLVVRAAEGSECQRALPRGITWMRGRSADERASLIRPKLPSAASCAALIQELSALLLSAPEPASKKAAKSAGKGLSTANAGTRSSPAHAT